MTSMTVFETAWIRRLLNLFVKKLITEMMRLQEAGTIDFWPSRDSQVKKSKTESILDSKMPQKSDSVTV